MPDESSVGPQNDIVRPEVVSASKILQEMFDKLGKPESPFSESGERMVKIITAVWEDLYPLQAKMWYEERKDYQANEMDVKEQVRKHTGRSLASYPLPIYNMFKKIFPKTNLADRKTCLKMVKKWPMFRMTNKA